MKSIITPVLEEISNTYLKEQLLRNFGNAEHDFRTIEDTFRLLTSSAHDREKLNVFFHSWSMTNNSAMTVAGLSNRLTMLVHKNRPVQDEGLLLRSITSLNRIVDEDLGVVGGVLHKDIYYKMATHFCKGDEWMLMRYLTPEAKEFKSWKDRNSLKEMDLVTGLLTTVVHEIYTHGEVEYILPLFEQWLETQEGISGRDAQVILAWIIVHTGPTEKNHFYHAIHAVEQYTQSMGIRLEDYDLEEIIRNYMQRKAATMASIAAVLQPNYELN